jgi:membrane peptidoglycan carboxypeptidase
MSGSQHKPESFAKGFLKFTGFSALAGLLGVALLAPTALVSGIAATAGITIFENLPDYIKPINASQSSTLYATKDGQPVEVAQFYHENRISIDYNEMSPNIRNAVVATEDPRFFEHGGVDWLSLVRATITSAATLGNGPGGSTITMQYVKNSLVTRPVSPPPPRVALAVSIASFAKSDWRLLLKVWPPSKKFLPAT